MYNCGRKLEEECDRIEGSVIETDDCEDEDWGSKYVIVGACRPGSEKKKERESFWFNLGELVGSFENDEIVCVLRDLNARVVDRKV